MNEDLRKWFSQKWVRMDTKGNIKGDCAREPGEGKPKCLPLAKASSMDKEDRAAAARRKRREDPVADRSGKGEKPINVATEEVSTSDLIKKSHSKRGAPGTLKAKIQGPLTLAKVRSLKNRANATTLDKKQANFYINMHSEEYLEEKNVPTNPGLWARAKSLARLKFDVYPSAYANGWAAKWYKGKGGSWKSVQEGKQMKSLKDILSEGVAVSSDFKLVNSVNAQGKPITRKVRAHRKTISPQSEDKSDVLTSIQKFVGRQYDEEVINEKLDSAADDMVKGAEDMRAGNTLKGAYKTLRGANQALDAGGATLGDKASLAYTAAKAGGSALLAKVRGKDPEAAAADSLAKSAAGYLSDVNPKQAASTAQEYRGPNAKKLSDHPDFAKAPKEKQQQAMKLQQDIDNLSDDDMKAVSNFDPKKVVSNLKSSTQKEEVELDEVSTDGYYKAAIKDRMKQVVKFMGGDKSAKTKIDARNAGMKRVEKRTQDEMKKANSGPQKPRVEKEPTEAERRGYGQGRYMGDSYELQGQVVEGQSPSMRMFKALQKIKKQREEEEARKKENEKRALTPKQTNEAKDPREYDYEGDMAKTQLRSIIANSQAVHDMLKDTTNLAEWVQSKITKAEDYISTVADYMTAEMNEQTYDPFADDPEAEAKHEAEVRAKMREKLQQGQGTKIKDMNPIDRDQYLQNTGRRWNDETKSIEKIKPQAAAIKEAKQEDDDEDYTKHHKLDPDSGVEADQHIHVQLKKAIDSTMKPYEVSFKNGKKHTVSSPVAKTIVNAIEKLKPEHRKAVHDELHKSYDSLMGVHKAITGK
jgi:hypothetical protein